jgi:serine/threonine protein kinase/WD40 repeat protein
MGITDSNSHITIEQLADSFMDRMRSGERPQISEYAQQYPELADEIREVFPALAVLEEFGPAPDKSARKLAEALALERLGDYRILREVGRGGMGVVYQAIQEQLGRHVALKVLPFQLSSDAIYLERFHREARVAARLHHTNIVPVFDVGEHSGIHYYAMQFIQGLSLDEVMHELRRMRGPTVGFKSDDRQSRKAALSHCVACSLLSDQFEAPAVSAGEGSSPRDPVGCASVESPIEAAFHQTSERGERAGESSSATLINGSRKSAVDATASVKLPGQAELSRASDSRQHYYRSVARVGLQVADALRYVHTQGLLHRDIKPSNLLLDTRGIVWITDLGLAREEEAAALTQSGDVVGTLRYMAPERFRGLAYPSSDLYSLGLTLYELLTLRAAFEQSDRGQLLHQISSAEPPHPRKIDPNLPRDLETIVLKTIDKEPLRRYQTADELTADLRSFLEDRPIRARRTGTLERSWRWCRRNRALAALASSVAALLLMLAAGGGLVALLFRDQALRMGDQAEELRRQRALATRRLYDALFAQAQASRWSGRVGQRIDSLGALTEAAKLVPQLGLGEEELLRLRNQAIACMALTDLRLARTPHSTPPDTKLLTFDADLKHYVWSDRDGSLSIRHVADHVEVARLPGPGFRAHVARFSPNGQYLAAKYHDLQPPIVKVWDLDYKTPFLEYSGTHAFDFSPDSLLFARGNPDGSVQIFDLISQHWIGRLPPGPEPSYLRFHPDGQRIAVCGSNSNMVRILDVANESQVAILRHPKPVFAVSWEPEGKLLASACADYRVHVWNTQLDREQAVLVGHQSDVVDVAFNRSGDLLASYAWDGTTRLWDAWTGQHWVSATGDFRQFSPDGKYLAFIGRSGPDNLVGMWEVAKGIECRTLSEPRIPDKGPTHLDISPDGRLMVSTGPGGLRLWDLASAKEITMLVGASETSGRDPAAVFHPSADSLLTSGSSGLHRWPIRRELDENRTRLVVGPPSRMLDIRDTRLACLDRVGRTVATLQGDGALVVGLDRASEPVQLKGHTSMSRIAISPDGQWIVTGTWRGSGVKLWNAQTGQEVRDLFADADSATVAFSPDGRWLVAGANDMYRFWEVGPWKHVRDIAGSFPYSMAFTADGRMMAISQSRQVVRLVDPDTGQQRATLESPSLQLMSWLTFTPDGSQLAVACATHVIHLWDLGRIREQLAAIELDWDLPTYPPRDPVQAAELQVQVDAGELGTPSHTGQL